MDNLMTVFLIFCSMLCFSTQQIGFKLFNQRYMKSMASYFLFMAMNFLVMFLAFLVTGGIKHVSPVTVYISLAYGAMFILTVFCYMKAAETGPLPYTSLFYASSLLVPTVYGLFAWGENIAVWQWVGLALLMCTYYLSSTSGLVKFGKQKGAAASATESKRFNLKWLLYALGAMFFNGTLSVLQKSHQLIMKANGAENMEISEFLSLAFVLAFALSVGAFVVLRRWKKQEIFKFSVGIIPVLIMVAGMSLLGNVLSMTLNSRIPSIIQFPVVSAGMVILTTALTALVYKERPDRKGMVSIAIGLVSVVLIALSF